MNQPLSRPPTRSQNPAFTAPLRLGVLLLTIGCYCWVFWPSLSSMAAIWWRSETFAHGMFIPLISAWLIWRQRDRLVNIPQQSSWIALIAVGIGTVIWLLAQVTDIAALGQLAAVGILIALVPTLFGLRLFWALLFPLLYLLFMVPIGEELTPALQQITADITVRALQLTGIPVYINGLFIEIPTGKFEVAEACSGVRYLIASLAVGTLYAYLNYTRLRTRLLFILASLLVPIVANGIRAYLIVLIAHLSEMKYATGVDHLIYGWLFFGVVIALMFWIGSFWRDPQSDTTMQASTRASTTQARAGALIAGCCIGLFIASGVLQSRLADDTRRAPLTDSALAPQGWTPVSQFTPHWTPSYLGADRQQLAFFTPPLNANAPSTAARGTHTVGIYNAQYQYESQGKELINQNNRLETDPAWTFAGQQRRTLSVEGQSLTLIETELRHISGLQRRIWHWYRANGQRASSALQVKLLQGMNRISGNLRSSAVIALATDYQQTHAAEQRLQLLLTDLWPQLQRQLHDASQASDNSNGTH